jgi:Holliday junction resolvase RusA-like endonuclease
MIEAFFAIDPGKLAINRAKRCRCVRSKFGSVKPVSYTDPAHTTAFDEVHLEAKRQLRRHGLPVYPDGPVVVEIESCLPRQHQHGPAAGLGLLDDDAPVKAVRDALEGIAYTDDAQVVRTVSSKTTNTLSTGPVGIRVRIYRPEEA